MAMDTADEGFKITDRRRRDDAAESAEPSPGPEAAAVPPTGGVQPGASEEAGRREPPADSSLDAGRTLVGLFMMLASSAVVALGEAPDPLTGERHRDPGQAAEAIDLLALLREKTEGNRTAEESQLLDELIYDLQLRYVEAMKRAR